MRENKQKMSLRAWLPLLGMTVSAFIFNTSEFMPIGLLTDIAEQFGISESRAGLLISVYSWVVMLLSLPLMLLVSKMSYRKLILGTIALFGVFQVLSGVSSSYGMLMASRIGVACTHAIFWSIASPIAVRLVPEAHRTLAMSMIVTGTSIAMIFGLPLGRVIGLTVGWRMTFLCVAAVSFLVFAYLCVVFPKLQNGTPFQVRQLPQILKRRVLLGIYLVTFLVAGAYYTGYSYIEPFLKQVAQLSDQWVTIVLTLFGAAGLLGSFLFSCFYERHRYGFIQMMITCVAAALLCLQLASVHLYWIVLVCVVWGMAVTAFNVAFQAETMKAVPPEASAIAMSLYSGIFNLGIGCGTYLGGAVCDQWSVSGIGYAGGLLGLFAILYCAFRLLVLMKRQEKLKS